MLFATSLSTNITSYVLHGHYECNFAAAESGTDCLDLVLSQWLNVRKLDMIKTLPIGSPSLPCSDFKVFLSFVSIWLNRRRLMKNLPQKNRL